MPRFFRVGARDVFIVRASRSGSVWSNACPSWVCKFAKPFEVKTGILRPKLGAHTHTTPVGLPLGSRGRCSSSAPVKAAVGPFRRNRDEVKIRHESEMTASATQVRQQRVCRSASRRPPSSSRFYSSTLEYLDPNDLQIVNVRDEATLDPHFVASIRGEVQSPRSPPSPGPAGLVAAGELIPHCRKPFSGIRATIGNP
jgi:hypothetical protein